MTWAVGCGLDGFSNILNFEWGFIIDFRYNEIFFMIDTCQAASMYEKFYSPNILAVASSLVGEDSLSVS